MDEPSPGTYKHFKGDQYLVHGVAEHSETLEKFVVYQNKNGKWWIRPLSNWNEPVNKPEYIGPRFTKVLENHGT